MFCRCVIVILRICDQPVELISKITFSPGVDVLDGSILIDFKDVISVKSERFF